MKNFLKIFIFIIGLVLLNSCAKPTVVNIVVPGDEKLNCEQLENVDEDETVKEFNKLHSHINKIRGG